MSAIEKLDEYEAWLIENELSDNTIYSYMHSVQRFFDEYPELTQMNAVRWKKSLLESGLSPKTVNLKLNALRSYCEFSGTNIKIKSIKLQKQFAVENVISKEQYHGLLDGLAKDKNWRWYWYIRLMAGTGARASELIRLRKSDLDRGFAEMQTKGKIRQIFIPNSLRESDFWKDAAPDSFLMQNLTGGAITTRGLDSDLKLLAKRYGIDKTVMHAHSFRHFFAISFLAETGNLSLLSDVLGHSNIGTTAIYTRMSSKQQAKIVDEAVSW